MSVIRAIMLILTPVSQVIVSSYAIILVLGFASVGEASSIDGTLIVERQHGERHIAASSINRESKPAVERISLAQGSDESHFMYLPFEREPIACASNKNGTNEGVRLNVMGFGHICPTALHIGTTDGEVNIQQSFLAREQSVPPR